jgi:hypothetical protein
MEKVDICHFQPENGSWKLLSVGQSSVDAHFKNHDDAIPGGTTSQTGTPLDADCNEVTVVCPCDFSVTTIQEAVHSLVPECHLTTPVGGGFDTSLFGVIDGRAPVRFQANFSNAAQDGSGCVSVIFGTAVSFVPLDETTVAACSNDIIAAATALEIPCN